MPQFFASCPKGLVEPLENELRELGLQPYDRSQNGVFFDGNWESCYKVNLHSRFASRILKPILNFTAYRSEELYHNILKHDFTKYIDPQQTIKVEASTKESMLKDQRFIAMKVKDAIVDQFREKTGVRPSVDNERPDLIIYVKAYKNHFSVAIDTSGDSLFMRGYRLEAGEAPLKENLAAGLLQLSEWDRKTPIVDPMCGSGTILIEAAMMVMNIAPGSMRKRFGFMRLKGFQKDMWEQLVDEAVSAEKEDCGDLHFYGYDIERRVLMKAIENAKRAGVNGCIKFKRESVTTLTPPVEKGLIVTNPPYGARLGDEDNLRDVYRDFSHTLKTQFKGWNAWILSGNKDLIADLKLKASRKHFVYNGSIECRFLRYEIR
ncbi:MAG: class I SAM-dependent RNA methyltransferase [Bdellovibrionales bacterium]